MVALSVVFARFLGYSPEGTPFRFEIGFLPIAVAAYAFGPLYSGLAFLIADIIGSLYSGYAPNIFISLCQLLSGAAMGFFFHKKNISLSRTIIAFSAIAVVIEIIAKSPIFVFMYAWSWDYTILTRLLNALINLPIRVTTFYFLMKALKKPIDKHL